MLPTANGQGDRYGRDGSHKALVSTAQSLQGLSNDPCCDDVKPTLFHPLPVGSRPREPIQPTSIEQVGTDAYEIHLPLLFIAKCPSAAKNGPIHSSAASLSPWSCRLVIKLKPNEDDASFEAGSKPSVLFALGIITANTFAQQGYTRPI